MSLAMHDLYKDFHYILFYHSINTKKTSDTKTVVCSASAEGITKEFLKLQKNFLEIDEIVFFP